MTMDPAHGTIGGEETDQRDVQKNNFADLGDTSQPHQEPRRVNNDPRAKQQKGNQPRRDRRDVHGWVVLDKPIGMTSTQAVAVLKRLFNAKRAGHAGTLDPLASGGLPIALGEATKTVPFVMDGRKRYQFTVCWGEERDTDDIEGRVTATSDQRPTREAIEALLPRFTGVIQQTPPRYSAIKIQGERAYDLARDGEVVELAPRPVEIHHLALVDQPDSDKAVFEAECGKGTYVRALARDLGNQLGVGAHLIALRREAIGSLVVEDAVPLEQLGPAALLSPQSVLRDLPSVDLDETERKAVVHGRAVKDSGAAGQRAGGAVVALMGGGELIAVAQAEDGWLRPTVVLDTS